MSNRVLDSLVLCVTVNTEHVHCMRGCLGKCLQQLQFGCEYGLLEAR